jgi:hypothetical protein
VSPSIEPISGRGIHAVRKWMSKSSLGRKFMSDSRLVSDSEHRISLSTGMRYVTKYTVKTMAYIGCRNRGRHHLDGT